MASEFMAENLASRQRLEKLAARLSDDDLARRTPYGWTIGALLAHLAWWDQRVSVLLRRWTETGVDESPVDSEAINETLRPFCHALEPRAALRLCLSAAQEADAAIEGASPELIAQISASPNQFRFNRALHRSDHIADIEALMRGA